MPEVRLATPADLADIWALVCRAVTHMNALGNPQWGADYPTRDLFAHDIAQGQLYAAVDACGSILGVAAINTEQAPQYAPLPWTISAPAIVPHRFAVDPDAQRQGVARSLFAHAEALAVAAGIATLHMDTYALNDRMLALVARLGYRKVGSVHFDRSSRPLPYPCFEKLL